MEKYYLIDNNSEVAKAYWVARQSELNLVKEFDAFAKEVGIEASKFHPDTDLIWVEPTKNDIKKFSKEFRSGGNGKFKKTSKTNKKWVKWCEKNNIVLSKRPFIPFVFNNPTKCSWRLFDVSGNVYCTFECNRIEDIPDGFVELAKDDFVEIMDKNHVIL